VLSSRSRGSAVPLHLAVTVLIQSRVRVLNSQCSTSEPPMTPQAHVEGVVVMLLRKEVIQPHLPVRLPCYDFVPIAGPTFDRSLPLRGWATGFGCC
jgi:hypothetical protein